MPEHGLLGRLQTERDKNRVIEGLEGASAMAGSKFDRAKIDQMLAGLGNRVFLMNNVHDNQPSVFQTRWCLSYLRGPLVEDRNPKINGAAKAESRNSRYCGSDNGWNRFH